MKKLVKKYTFQLTRSKWKYNFCSNIVILFFNFDFNFILYLFWFLFFISPVCFIALHMPDYINFVYNIWLIKYLLFRTLYLNKSIFWLWKYWIVFFYKYALCCNRLPCPSLSSCHYWTRNEIFSNWGPTQSII
jgi:hypothetical protein